MYYTNPAPRSAMAACLLGAMAFGTAWSAEPPAATSKHAATSSSLASVAASLATASSASRVSTASTASTATANTDPLAADVLGDAELATARGGTDSHLNQNNATGTVTGNTASQLNTGSNTIGQSAFSNSSGIPIVIQNSGNNVLIQNSTILNLQLTNPK